MPGFWRRNIQQQLCNVHLAHNVTRKHQQIQESDEYPSSKCKILLTVGVTTEIRTGHLTYISQHHRLSQSARGRHTWLPTFQGILKMEAECLSETLASTSHNTRYHNQKEKKSSFRLRKRHSIGERKSGHGLKVPDKSTLTQCSL